MRVCELVRYQVEEVWVGTGEAREALGREEAKALQRSHPTLPQCPFHLADSGPTDVSAPGPRDAGSVLKQG